MTHQTQQLLLLVVSPNHLENSQAKSDCPERECFPGRGTRRPPKAGAGYLFIIPQEFGQQSCECSHGYLLPHGFWGARGTCCQPGPEDVPFRGCHWASAGSPAEFSWGWLQLFVSLWLLQLKHLALASHGHYQGGPPCPQAERGQKGRNSECSDRTSTNGFKKTFFFFFLNFKQFSRHGFDLVALMKCDVQVQGPLRQH